MVTVAPVSSPSATQEDLAPAPSITRLRELVETQWDTVVAIATGSSIDSQKAGYRQRHAIIRTALRKRGLPDPFRWDDADKVSAWARRWDTYEERRAEIGRLVKPLLDQLENLERSGNVDDWGGSPDEWTEIEKRLSGLRNEIDHATTLDDYQDVGRRSREVLIHAVDLVFAPDMVPEGEEQPKAGDAKTRFDFIVGTHAPGRSRRELRKLMLAAWDLAQKATHGDNVKRVDAFAAAQATVLIVRTLVQMNSEAQPADQLR